MSRSFADIPISDEKNTASCLYLEAKEVDGVLFYFISYFLIIARLEKNNRYLVAPRTL